MTDTNAKLTKKDFVPGNMVRWCPGCGDYAILNSVQKIMPELGIPKENFVVISGIGCSSRFPYYMDTYGFHTIHGRAPGVATGVKVTNPDLSLWVITGDGDGLSIGGNHMLHMLRRNIDMNVLLFNNKIYGLTKGQYSPTSEQGKKTKTSPLGSLDYPINPISFALSAEATFIARTYDANPKHMASVFKQAAEHKGISFVEILQNCVIFNKGTYDKIYSKENRDDNMIFLEEGKPMIFGKEKEKGLSFDGMNPKVVNLADLATSTDAVLVHDPKVDSPACAYMLSQLEHPDYPIPVGVFRNVEKPTYDKLLTDQVESAIKSGSNDLQSMVAGPDTWEIK